MVYDGRGLAHSCGNWPKRKMRKIVQVVKPRWGVLLEESRGMDTTVRKVQNKTLVGKPHKHKLQSQGHVKMAYCCSKFNAYCLLCLAYKGQHNFEGPGLSVMLTQTTISSVYSCRLLKYFIQGPPKGYVMHSHD